ncbi:MAG: hypothetical protein JWR61_5305 [Ferruginibacter sp.]|uniref:glycosyltransferase family 2 protein n=1 Tax=Ferruginibacter sp. TaxID=1940288 RepID=UPI0026591ECB|nr:glycosyltransferase family 2 protein [Ferruginibacter sp.]MDB5280350.1 hypothetical protein [Ferruginibacter sp.]
MPALSIITISYNNHNGLFKTIPSVLNQTFTDYEYIIIDGGSNDGSTELIEKYAQQITYWVSEKDAGIFNAMNKGIAKAKGAYLLFLNAGDYLFDSAVLKNVFDTNPAEDIIYGNVVWDPVKYQGKYPAKLSFEFFINNALPHQASFIKKELFDRVGLYDERYEMNSDWTFFLLAIYKFNSTYKHIDLFITYCNTDGISLKEGSWEKIMIARKEVMQQHFAAFMHDFELFCSVRNELSLVKRTKGYRIHIKLRSMLTNIFKIIKPNKQLL